MKRIYSCTLLLAICLFLAGCSSQKSAAYQDGYDAIMNYPNLAEIGISNVYGADGNSLDSTAVNEFCENLVRTAALGGMISASDWDDEKSGCVDAVYARLGG